MKRYKTIFISDCHIGINDCQSTLLLKFISNTDAERYYLIGDIFDAWQLRRTFYWEPVYNEIIQKIIAKAKKGAKIIYVPGNHDEFLRPFVGLTLGTNIEIKLNDVYETGGRKFYITHGDEFDAIMQIAPWLMHSADAVYMFLLKVNRRLNQIRLWFKMDYWSFSQWAKHKAKKAVAFIKDFERAMLVEAKRKDCVGVICGHIHNPVIKDNGFYNCGDWIENCTALVETMEGKLELVYAK